MKERSNAFPFHTVCDLKKKKKSIIRVQVHEINRLVHVDMN